MEIMKMAIEHFSHQHPLILRDHEKRNDDGDECYACCLPISGDLSYGCSQCKEIFIHKSCAEILQHQIQHPFHPHHPLALLPKPSSDSGERDCDACGKSCSGFIFHCAACNFYLDVGCASLAPSVKYEGHGHLLTLFDEFYAERECLLCGELCDGFVYRCVECDLNLHKLCAVLKFIQDPNPFHLLHSLHPLTFTTSSVTESSCSACSKPTDHLTFCCKECDFTLCYECFSLHPSFKYEGHEHLLTFFPYYWNDSLCSFCGDKCFGSVFRCVECDFNVHQVCGELLKKMQHPFHRHPLTLFPKKISDLELTDMTCCQACGNACFGFVYSCAKCDFHLDPECASLVSTMSYEGHYHLLTLFENISWDSSESNLCNSCDAPCHDPWALRCLRCNFNLHIDCCPSLLPITIKHECHPHPLALTDSVVEELGDPGEVYCDACEEKRNRKHSVYYCAECSFVAHISCVISKVLPSLVAEQKSKMTRIKAEIKLSSTVEGSPDANEGDEVVAKSVSTAMPSKEVGVEATTDPTLAKLNGDIAKVLAQLKALDGEVAKLHLHLEALESERAVKVCNMLDVEMLSARAESLSEASTSE